MRAADPLAGITNTTRMKISPPKMPPRLSERVHDGGDGSRGRRDCFAPFCACAGFGLSGLPFSARISFALTGISLPSSS